MRLTLVSAPATEPLTVAEAKLHLRVDVSDDDALITSLIVAARQHVENFTRRALITQTWDVLMDRFCGDEIVLPKAPVSAVGSIKYYDTSGALQTWSSDEYLTEFPVGPQAGPARITPISGVAFPSTQDRIGAVQIRITAGYGAASAVPDGLKAAMRLLIGHWYGNREAVVTGAIATDLPQAIDSLLWPFKVFA